MDFQPTIIRNKKECQKVLLLSGFSIEYANKVDSLCEKTGIPHRVTCAGMVGERVYVILYFSGYKNDEQNGWQVLRYENLKHYYLHLPEFVDEMDELEGNQLILTDIEATCNN